MAADGTIDATNPLYISLVTIFCIIAFIVPFLCIAGVVVSKILRKKEKPVAAVIVLCLPFVIFLLNLGLLAVVETLPRAL